MHVDLAFLRKHMPRLVDHLHYRWAALLGLRFNFCWSCWLLVWLAARVASLVDHLRYR